MGTRNLTMVAKNGKIVVANYGQWDGYPDGNGLNILSFARNFDKEFFSKQIDKVVDVVKSDYIKNRFGVEVDDLSDEQNELLFKENPHFSRDTGAAILSVINDNKADVLLTLNKESFAADSLFCEWAYVIDLDKDTLEVYEGFNKTPLEKSERFEYLSEKSENGYYPIRLVKKYSLLDLPTNNDFLNDLKSDDE